MGQRHENARAIACMAHELSNVLTVIEGHVSLLLRGEELRPQCLESLMEIHVAAQRAMGLTRRLMVLGHAEGDGDDTVFRESGNRPEVSGSARLTPSGGR